MPLTVAIDTGPLVRARTGIGQFVTSLIDGLSRVADPPTLRPYVLSLRATLPDGTRRLPYPARLTLQAWGRSDRPSAARSLRGADVVHGTNFVVPPSGRPSVVTVHDCSLVTHPMLVDPVVRLFVPVLRRAVARGAWVHTPSAYVAGQVRELFGTDRVSAIHHGAPPAVVVDASMPRLPGLDGRPYVLSVGTREPRKNHARLVEAFGLLHAEQPELALVLVGSPGPAQGAIDAAIASLSHDAASQVLITDWLPEAQRNAALQRAEALAYPSLDEGFGLPMLEAMRAGVPVVASTAGALAEVAGDAALLVAPDDAVALAGALRIAITDSAERVALVERGHDRVDTFSWDDTARAMVELYRTVMADIPGRPR